MDSDQERQKQSITANHDKPERKENAQSKALLFSLARNWKCFENNLLFFVAFCKGITMDGDYD